ncbi:MAG: hydrolase 1, exosortase A system-associated [Sphingomonas sp.]
MRRLISFPCEGETLIGTLDEAPGTTGVLIVSGGNEIRAGAHRGMALLAQRLAATGVPVFRYDRRGVGDSSGKNTGYEGAGPDLAAAITAFRDAAPGLTRLLAFGNCDGASAILLQAPDIVDRVALANPWITDSDDGMPPAAAIRARYAGRWRDPGAWRALIRGEINIGKLISGLRKIAASRHEAVSDLEERVFTALAAHPDAHIVLAKGDATAISFADAARKRGYPGPIETIETDSHSFARAVDADALFHFLRRLAH